MKGDNMACYQNGCTRYKEGVVVQWLDYSPVTQEPGAQFPTGEKVVSSI